MRKICLIIALFVLSQTSWATEKPLNIVATQTIFADLVRKIGGDKVNVSSVASPKFNIHFIQPKPSDVRKVAKADLYVNNGLDLEAWSDPLLEAAGNPNLFRNAPGNVNVSQGIQLLNVPTQPLSRAEGDIHLFGNPHFHMSPDNIRIISQTILNKLKERDPRNSDYYEGNFQKFLGQWNKKVDQWKSLCTHCREQEIISYHEDMAYLADYLGMIVQEYVEPKPGIQPTPKHLEFLEKYARERQIKAIIMPTYYPGGQAKRIADHLGIKVVIIAQAVGEVPDTDDIFKFFDYNFQQISEALK